MTGMLLVQIMALAMWVSIVCRVIKMTEATAEPVRLAVVAQGAASFCLFVLPFGHPQWFVWLVAAYVAATLAMQAVTARFWRRGTPPQFNTDGRAHP